MVQLLMQSFRKTHREAKILPRTKENRQLDNKPPEEEDVYVPKKDVHVFHFNDPILHLSVLRFMFYHLNDYIAKTMSDDKMLCAEPVCRLKLRGDTSRTQWDAIVSIIPYELTPHCFLTEDGDWQVMAIEIDKVEPPTDDVPAGLTPYDYGIAHGFIGCDMSGRVFVVFTDFSKNDTLAPLVIASIARRYGAQQYTLTKL